MIAVAAITRSTRPVILPEGRRMRAVSRQPRPSQNRCGKIRSAIRTIRRSTKATETACKGIPGKIQCITLGRFAGLIGANGPSAIHPVADHPALKTMSK